MLMRFAGFCSAVAFFMEFFVLLELLWNLTSFEFFARWTCRLRWISAIFLFLDYRMQGVSLNPHPIRTLDDQGLFFGRAFFRCTEIICFRWLLILTPLIVVLIAVRILLTRRQRSKAMASGLADLCPTCGQDMPTDEFSDNAAVSP